MKKKIRLMRIISAILIICMAFVDAGLFSVLKNMTSSNCNYQVEDYYLPYAGADGYYGGDNSSNESYNASYIEDKEKKSLFNILEIVPQESMGVIGYTISGCEPLYTGSDPIMNEAYMDALLNKTPGASQDMNLGLPNGNDQNGVPNDMKEMNNKFGEGAGINAFTFESGKTYSGYYKKVSSGQGVYAIATKSDGSYLIDRDAKSAVMVSKFYPTAYSNTGNFDYVFVYTDESNIGSTEGDYSTIYVKEHKRLKYINNNKFFVDAYKVDDVEKWREDNQVEVVTRSPKTLRFDDIERADLIIMNSGQNMDYYRFAVNLSNTVNKKNESRINFSSTNDIDFNKAVRIYERVAVREDVAFIASKNCVNGHTFDTNIRKLMCMLFYVNNGSNTHGSGRLMFMDYLKRYGENPGSHETYNPATGTMMKYTDIRTDDERFIAPSLKGKTNGYMHQSFPFVKTAEEAITGGHYEDGVLVAEHDVSKAVKVTAVRKDKSMYEGDGFLEKKETRLPDPYDEETNPEGYDYGLNPEGYNFEIRYDDNGNITGYYEVENPNGYYYIEDKDNGYSWYAPFYESKSNTTDYVYIDDDGNFVRSDKYSGYWYQLDDTYHDSKREYKRVFWSARTESTWPWDIVEGSCIKDWWFASDITTNGHIHLYYDYYAWGGYRAINDPQPGTYKNQSLEQENDLFKADLIKDAIEGREVKREETDDKHVVEGAKTKNVYYYIGLNIVNGDGFNKYTTGSKLKNKVIYYNNYEVTDSKKPQIPINFIVRSSSPIVKLELIPKRASSPTLTYSWKSSNNLELVDDSKVLLEGEGGIELSRIIIKEDAQHEGTYEYDKDGNPLHPLATTGPPDEKLYVYPLEGTISASVFNYDTFYNVGASNSFTLRATIEPAEGKEVYAEDTITISVRDFFELN